MIGTNKIALFGALVVMGFAALPAHATLSNTEILIIDSTHLGGVLFTCSSVGASCSTDNQAFTITYSDTIFNVGITASANSPDGPASLSLDVSTQSKAGSAGTPNKLTVELSTIGFLQPVGQGFLDFSATQNATGGTIKDGSSTARGFIQTGSPAGFFCASTATCTGNTGPATAFASLGPSSGGSTTTTHFSPTFSFEEVITQSFKGATKNGANSQTTADMSAVLPEPAGVVLLGTVVLFAAKSIRRKTRKA